MIGKEYKVGDKIWFIPGLRGHGLIVIECLITHVDDEFRKKEPQAYLFYDIDDVCGHDLADDEIYDTLEDALDDLAILYEERLALPEEDRLCAPNPNVQLSYHRRQSADFIFQTHTHLTPKERQEEKEEYLQSLPNKEYGKQWFNYQYLVDNGLVND